MPRFSFKFSKNKNRGSQYQRKGKRKSKNKALSGIADTFIERVARRQAKLEVDKNKKQKYLVYVQKGFLHAPLYDTSQNGEYTEPYIDAAGVTTHTPLYGQEIMVYPKIRTLPKDVQIDLSNPNFQTAQGNQHIAFIDGNEWGYGRTGDSIMVKAFKINIEIEPNPNNVTNNEVQLDLVFYESYGDDTQGKKTAFNQYIMPSLDQKAICSQRMIQDILGSSAIGATNPLKSATPEIKSSIKKLLLKKTWILKVKQNLRETTGVYEYVQTNIKNEFYIPINKKIVFSRSEQMTGGGIRKHTNLAISTQGTQGIGTEVTDSFENRKYYLAIKSNQAAPPVGYAPVVKLICTTYFTDIN